MDNLKDIVDSPTVIHNNHESLYRSYQTLQYVIKMVERGDSKETIQELVQFIFSVEDIKYFGQIKIKNIDTH